MFTDENKKVRYFQIKPKMKIRKSNSSLALESDQGCGILWLYFDQFYNNFTLDFDHEKNC